MNWRGYWCAWSEFYCAILTTDSFSGSRESEAVVSGSHHRPGNPTEEANHVEAATTRPVGDVSEAPRSDTQAAAGHFRVLISFVDKYLQVDLQLYDDLRSGKLQSVSFHNLWMLYDDQPTLCCQSRKGGVRIKVDDEDWHEKKARDTPQAYEVIAITGGLPLAVPDSEAPMKSSSSVSKKKPFSRNKVPHSPLTIDCYYLDFDGTRIAAVSERFVIMPFDGLMDINNLEVYPTNTNPRLQDGFFDIRGRQYLDLLSPSYQYYAGWTLGPNREMVR